MCGRYVTVSSVKTIEKRFGVAVEDPEAHLANTNVCPGEGAPVIASDRPGEVQRFTFGFTPRWAKKPMYVINARSEGDHNQANDPRYNGARGIINKPMFRHSIRSQRCLVIADAFIEGPEKEKLSKPYVVYLRNKDRPFAMAGIWDEWTNLETGDVLRSFAIITTVANEVLQAIGHHRSPVILPREHEREWLNAALPLAEITAMLTPYNAGLMNAYPIDAAIKNPALKSIDALQPIGERVFPETEETLHQATRLQGMGRRTQR
jgi:putative SOS response-associated peptidase YedK